MFNDALWAVHSSPQTWASDIAWTPGVHCPNSPSPTSPRLHWKQSECQCFREMLPGHQASVMFHAGWQLETPELQVAHVGSFLPLAFYGSPLHPGMPRPCSDCLGGKTAPAFSSPKEHAVRWAHSPLDMVCAPGMPASRSLLCPVAQGHQHQRLSVSCSACVSSHQKGHSSLLIHG